MKMGLAPNAQNLYLGAGSVYFDRFDANGNSTGLRHLGNVDTFEITTSVEVKEKKNAMDGLRATYAEVPIGSSAELNMAITEFTKENIALAVIGADTVLTQAAVATVTDRAVGPATAGDVQLDKWYEIGAYDVTVSAVKQGATTLNASAYTLDLAAGLIRLNSSYTGTNKAVAGTLITWSGSVPEIAAADDRWTVQALSTSSIRGHVKYVSAPNQTMGPRVAVDVWLCGLNPDGALGLITEDFGTFNLKGKVYADTSKAVGEQYFRIVKLKAS
jgi:hypothetical protein